MNKTILDEINDRVPSIKDERKKKLITSILKKNDWYLSINLDTFISILIDLGYSKEEALNIYKDLVVE